MPWGYRGNQSMRAHTHMALAIGPNALTALAAAASSTMSGCPGGRRAVSRAASKTHRRHDV